MTIIKKAKPKASAGRPDLEDQALIAHGRQETRIDLAMAEVLPKIIKHYIKMVNEIEKQPPATQIKLMDKAFGHNKEVMKMFREGLAAKQSEAPQEEDEDDSLPMLDLSSAPIETQKLN